VRSSALRVNVGEHTLEATAPGYARMSESLQVASGEQDVVVKLEPITAFVDVRSTDPSAAIALDGKPVAFGHVLSPITPNEAHLVQIYKEGGVPFEQRVTAALGQTVVVNGQPSVPAAAANTANATNAPFGAAATAVPPPALGWYGLGSVSLLATGSTPFRFDLSDAQSRAWGLGVHVGRRLLPAVAVEGLVEFDLLKVHHACDEYAGELAPAPILCGEPNEIVANYRIDSLRFGPTLELMTTDPRFRVIGGLGLGAVWHSIEVGSEQHAGVDPYFLLDVGVGTNAKHVLFALQARLILDGTRNMIDGRHLGPDGDVEEQAFSQSHGALAFVGLDLRVGYSEWSP
jgi:hypothetical protein